MIVNKYANGNGGGGGTGSTITVDAALSSSSTNPVENRVITTALSEYTTNEWVESRFDAAEAYTDSQVNNLEEQLSAAITAATENMATQDYVDTAINEELQDYATEAYVDNAITAATENMATEEYVDNAITAATQTFVTSGDVTTAITAATQNFVTEQYVNNAVSSASTEIYEYVDAAILTGATITVDDALSTASTNPVENRVIANALGDYVSKDELTGGTIETPVVLGQDSVWHFLFDAGPGYLKETNINNIFGVYIADVVGLQDAPYGIRLLYIYIDESNAYEFDVSTTATTGTKTQMVAYEERTYEYSIIPSTLDGTYNYYLFFDAETKQVWISKTAVIEEDVPGILDDYTTSGDVQTIVDAAVATAITIDSALSSSSTNPVENNVIYDALNGVSSTTQMEIIESATTSVCLSASTIGNIYFKETNLPDYLAINLGEYITGYTIFYGINDGTTSKFDTDTYDGGIIEPEKLGVRCPLYGDSNLSISSSNLDGTYNYYMVYNQVKKYVVIYKNLPVIAEVSDHAANISDVPAAQDGSDTKHYVYAGTGNKKVLTDVHLTTTVQHDSTFRRLNIQYTRTVWGNSEKNTSTFIIPGGNANQPGVKTYRDSVVIDNAMGALSGLTETKTLTIGNQTSNYIKRDGPYSNYYLCETDDPRYLVYHSVGDESILSEYVYLNGITYYYLNLFRGSSEDGIVTPDEVSPSAFTGCIMQLGEYKPGEMFNNSLHVSCPANSDTYFIVDKELHTIQVTDSLTFTRAKNIKETIDNNCVQSTDVRTMVKCTQAQYDAMATHDPNTFYIITNS